MKNILACLLLMLCPVIYGQTLDLTNVNHPRLLLRQGEETKIANNLKQSEGLQVVDRKIFEHADEAVTENPLPYKKEGRRLLYVCQRYVRNLYALAYAYRMSHEEKYLQAAIRHLTSACNYKDWNPSHFLDVAEMSMGVAIAYDWLYDQLPAATRALVEESLEKKAMDEALEGKYNTWYHSVNNWNQVCNAGMIYAAIAIGDKVPQKAQQLVDRYYGSISRALNGYEPDGAYPEGFLYWEYGTGLNVMLNYALEGIGMKPVGNDGAFLKSAHFYMNMEAPSGMGFNYCDGGSMSQLYMPLDISLFYFAAKEHNPSLVWAEMRHIAPALKEKNISTKEVFCRYLPSLLVYAKDMDMAKIDTPQEKTWTGNGISPVYVTRSAWGDPQATFLGVKAGTPSSNHGHMDIGSFVFESKGIRWAMDPGNDEYNVIETAGIDLWTMKQGAPRWRLQRYNNKFHNTITLDDADFKVDAKATFERIIDEQNKRGVVVDLTSCYDNVKKVSREIYLYKEKELAIHDNISVQKDMKIQWTLMLLPETEVKILSKHKIALTNQGKQLLLTFKAPIDFEVSTWPCKATTSYETLNTHAIGFKATIPADKEIKINVTMK